MSTYYSASTKGFYDTTVSDTMPSDVVAVTEDQWTALLAAQATGKQIVPDSQGNPVAVTPTPSPAPPPPVLTLAQQAQAALATGMPVVSTGTPALDGTYPVDAATQSHIQSEMLALLVNGTFADGASTVAWPDMAGSIHTFSMAEFKALAPACAAYVAGLFKVINGTATTLPATPVTIA